MFLHPPRKLVSYPIQYWSAPNTLNQIQNSKFQTWLSKNLAQNIFNLGISHHGNPDNYIHFPHQVSHVFTCTYSTRHGEHRMQWAGRGHSSARILPAKPVTPASTHSSTVLSFPPLEKEYPPIFHTGRWIVFCFFYSCHLWRISSLPCFNRNAGRHLHRLRGVSVHRHTEPNLHHTGGVKRRHYVPVQREKQRRNQHKKNSIEGKGEMEGRDRGGKQST